MFLDFDGVLNSGAFFRSDRYVERKELSYLSIEWWATAIDSLAIKLLNQIITRTGCVVIASTSWRNGATHTYLEQILKTKGFIGSFVGSTPVRKGEVRRNEIMQVVKSKHLETYAILDDDRDASIDDHFVWTDYKTGLTPQNVELAVKILGGLQ